MAYATYYKPELHGIPAAAAGPGYLQSVLAKYRAWRRRAKTLRQLRGLPDYMLKDIGLSRYQVETGNLHL